MLARFISKQPTYTWDAREVVRDLGERPHLLTRIEVRGANFPHMAREPFLRVVTDNRVVAEAWFVDVCSDNTCLRGYFGEDMPKQGVLEFGYGHDLMGRVDFDVRERKVAALDRKRLPDDIIPVTSEFIDERRRNR